MDALDFAKFIDWAFLGSISGGIGWMVIFLGKVNRSLHELNAKLGIVIERQTWHQSELEKHENRIQRLESNRKHT